MTQSQIFIPVISAPNELEKKHVDLNDFWQDETKNYLITDRTKIISYAHKITSLDPLAFLAKYAQANELHFYWENPAKQEAIAACGATKSTKITTSNRFAAAQQFRQTCWRQIVRQGETNLATANPYLFCNFTFFAESEKNASPFPTATIFLPRLQVIKQHKYCILIVNLPVKPNQKIKLISAKLKQQIDGFEWSSLAKIELDTYKCSPLIENAPNKNSEYLKSIITSALDSIAVDELSKVVIAHAIDVSSPTPFQIIPSLDNLRQRHPDCYIFSVGNGQGHNFIGASPERLISIQNRQLVTDALAGSAPRGKTTAEDVQLANLLLKSRKEKREHQAVSDFIIQRLRQLHLEPQQLPLQLLQLSNIQHLWTPIYAHLPHDIDPLEIVAHLHPTPAVAGVPTEIACEQIHRYENFDRSLYAAPLGWVDYQGNCEFVVGIRSALIKGDRARLYAGAGVVSGSNPDKEFAEIQLKLQSLLKALV